MFYVGIIIILICIVGLLWMWFGGGVIVVIFWCWKKVVRVNLVDGINGCVWKLGVGWF